MMSLSWLGFILVPQLQIGRLQQVEADGELYPSMRVGTARQGEQVYRANGCFYCHTEQVRPKGFGSDVERGWGGRKGEVQNVAEDYLYDRPAMLGDQRIGPDLANYGLRQTNAAVVLMHLYNPQLMPKSVMPPYRYLFDKRHLRNGETPAPDALPVEGLAADEEVVPTEEARQLAAYLLSLRSEGVLFDTPPPPPPPTNAAAGSTNVVATNTAATNAPPK